ncbi:hypothetical protein LX15_005848 [Streptoalloteichus tenebrarius]|uniref:Uncharacterized protein n=1 Tax=Streptoalloteichus tenebrarius (strain ATCC 17920 / DSM 40477 / JCM 4838 / CBS 697.72 / NBRC 16177 / NCIMB 11028 / NRRL B-12390 / A12253. 1 / ISP 5477) TaxID=1933 RepID=A0ABT1I2V9_STRSD|nr:hypothetical protein [Streptoalloteichus tenebrarius]MCP2262116.1 hypothetical protein [Streptoalloteichus tenebrarius]BFF02270.1 hypothetical protein GCM10020241_39450 [Streptoalloteichus tenebrarius]
MSTVEGWLNLVAPVPASFAAATGAVAGGAGAATPTAGASGAPVGAPVARFSIRTEDAPRLKAKFKEAIEEMNKALEMAYLLRHTRPPGEDPASGQAVQKLAEKITSDEGSLTMAIDSTIQALQSVIDQIDQALGQYQENDTLPMRS